MGPPAIAVGRDLGSRCEEVGMDMRASRGVRIMAVGAAGLLTAVGLSACGGQAQSALSEAASAASAAADTVQSAASQAGEAAQSAASEAAEAVQSAQAEASEALESAAGEASEAVESAAGEASEAADAIEEALAGVTDAESLGQVLIAAWAEESEQVKKETCKAYETDPQLSVSTAAEAAYAAVQGDPESPAGLKALTEEDFVTAYENFFAEAC